MNKPLHVAVVGLGFGAEFVPIYIHHPNVRKVTICDLHPERIENAVNHFGEVPSTTRFDDILNDPDIDAIHLITSIPEHAKQTIAALNAGKHCACTVPMATSLDDLHQIVEAQNRNSKIYMMMETTVYDRTFLYVKELMKQGVFSKIQMLRGAHYQDMENWPPYWFGLPPMWYATHAVAPLMALAGTRAEKVQCFGSGVMRQELHEQYGNPYPIETALVKFKNRPFVAEVTRALFNCARAYTECFNVYGEDVCFEWQQLDSENPVLFHLSPLGQGTSPRQTTQERITPPDRADLLPPEIGRFTRHGVYDEKNPHASFMHGGGHGGSHPHMVHEFVRACIEDRPSSIDAVTAANWTAVGICAHESAMNDGKEIKLPVFG
ncbi:Gfo/Idh/MocA family oxidoreductase [uncultured Desulfobulbus sp.]|uniref:Gfo/Idh/MocA family protein n=1 Tax=uncultured Desulfobulbus sp. TaxID=239745 RepID=UPI0029C68B64|nr:Gfo/Idh/MocA family oxidoreductase [uncultured Desulfobulbus sp.]